MRQAFSLEQGMRLTIFLAEDERVALTTLATQERRAMREQVGYLLRQKLEELGALPAAAAQAVEP